MSTLGGNNSTANKGIVLDVTLNGLDIMLPPLSSWKQNVILNDVQLNSVTDSDISKLVLSDSLSYKIVKDTEDNIYVSFSTNAKEVSIENYTDSIDVSTSKVVYVAKVDSNGKSEWITRVAHVSKDTTDPSVVVKGDKVHIVFFTFDNEHILHYCSLDTSNGIITGEQASISIEDINVNEVIVNCDLYINNSNTNTLHLIITSKTDGGKYRCYYGSYNVDNGLIIEPINLDNNNSGSVLEYELNDNIVNNGERINPFDTYVLDNSLYIMWVFSREVVNDNGDNVVNDYGDNIVEKHIEIRKINMEIVSLSSFRLNIDITDEIKNNNNVLVDLKDISFVALKYDTTHINTTHIKVCFSYEFVDNSSKVVKILNISTADDGLNKEYSISSYSIDVNQSGFVLEQYNNGYVLSGLKRADSNADTLSQINYYNVMYYFDNSDTIVYKTIDNTKYSFLYYDILEHKNRNFVVDSKGNIVYLNIKENTQDESSDSIEYVNLDLELRKISRQPIFNIEYTLQNTSNDQTEIILPFATIIEDDEEDEQEVIISTKNNNHENKDDLYSNIKKLKITSIPNILNLGELLSLNKVSEYNVNDKILIRVVGKFTHLGIGDIGDGISQEEIETIVNNAMISNIDGFNELSPYLKSTSSLFYKNTIYNQNIDDWDVSNILDMRGMFYEATVFNNGEVETSDMLNNSGNGGENDRSRSYNAIKRNSKTPRKSKNRSLNRNTDTQPSFSTWNVSNVSLFQSMFFGAISFNQDISNWDMSSAVDVISMLQGATAWNNGRGEDENGALYLLYIDGDKENGNTKFNETTTNVTQFANFAKDTRLLEIYTNADSGNSDIILYGLLFLYEEQTKKITIPSKGMVVKTDFAVTCGGAGSTDGVSISHDGKIVASSSLTTDSVESNLVKAGLILTTNMSLNTLTANRIIIGEYVLTIENGNISVSRLNSDCP
jgi:hypothetical protein